MGSIPLYIQRFEVKNSELVEQVERLNFYGTGTTMEIHFYF